VGEKAAKAVGTMEKKKNKLVEDEEEMTAADEPMGSVAAAVSRDQGSALTPAKAAEPAKRKEKG
jgi:hypothetical protein